MGHHIASEAPLMLVVVVTAMKTDTLTGLLLALRK